jgi:hypothetical protein
LLKIQQFYHIKLNSERLVKSKFNVTLTLDEARRNEELVAFANSELIRALHRMRKVSFSQREVGSLLKEKKRLSKKQDSPENRIRMKQIIDKIESLLYVEDLVTVEFSNKSHYRKIVKRNGFYVNGTKFTPFMASAGMIRKNTAMFINNSIKYQLLDILENGRNENVELSPAKYGAYFSLYSSSTLPVSFPDFAVVPDREIETIRRVNFVSYAGVDVDDTVTEEDRTIKANAWDGQGLISPRLAQKWSEDLEMDYVFSTAIIRAPYLKGMVCVFDMERFAIQVAGTYYFNDIYGIKRDIRETELIISESMFKLWSSYDNTESYIANCKKNNLGFSIAKVNPKEEKSHSRTSYQFLQVLNMDEKDIAEFCEPTLNWFRDMSGDDYAKMLVYSTGEGNFQPKDFNALDVSIKAMMVNPDVVGDRHIQKSFERKFEKVRKESFMGSLFVNANYSIMISDPYAQMAHVMSMGVKPLLQEGQHYCEYWSRQGIDEVVAIRSPIVHHSEVNLLNLQFGDEYYNWYRHIYSGVIFPANGIGMDCAIHGGADFDGDLICTINSPVMRRTRIIALPIVYESTKANKKIVDTRNDEEQVELQLLGHNSKVGFATNISSTLYAIRENFPEGSIERDTIDNRLIIGRVIQGEIIDSVKGLHVPPFRDHWTKYKKVSDDMTPAEIEKWKLYNSIICDTRPAFFRFLYSHYMSKWNKEIKAYDIYSRIVFKKTFKELLTQVKYIQEEMNIVLKYYKKSFFTNNASVVNRISSYMQTVSSLIGRYRNAVSKTFDHNIYKQVDFEPDIEKLKAMEDLVHSYRRFKMGLWKDHEGAYQNTEMFIEFLRKKAMEEISSNEAELASYGVCATYDRGSSITDFVWKVFPEGLLTNIKVRSTGVIRFPVKDPDGEIEYLWERYTIKEFIAEETYG